MKFHEFEFKHHVGGPYFDQVYECKNCKKQLTFSAIALANVVIANNIELYGDCDLEIINQVQES